jgi:protocatechuate 3,4-dioxygenase beta subunit
MTTPGKTWLIVAALAVLVGGCNTSSNDSPTTTQPSQSSTAAESVVTTSSTSTATRAPATTAPPSSTAPSQPAAGDIALPAELRATPRQGEGPYYPVTKPVDRDNNLLVVAGGEATSVGTPLEISGLLVYEDGALVTGGTIEIWQVDGQGIYDHPRAPGTDNRDPAFQFYGEAVTDADGFWTFLTVDPVLYESRPRHIHVKVKVDGAEVLTTQIYFDGDPLISEDGLAASAGDDIVLLTANAAPGLVSSGVEGFVAQHLIVLAR